MSITLRVPGEKITAAKWNDDRNELIALLSPTGELAGYSTNLTEFHTQTDPGDTGAESLPQYLRGELERFRYVIADMKGTTYWNEKATGIRARSLATASLPTASTAGRLAYLNDAIRGLHIDMGSQWVSVNGGYVNVKLFGAKGDNSTDDTSAISAAKTVTVTAGATLLFPPGTYKHTGQSVTTSHFKMLGVGNAILKHTGTGDNWYFNGTGGAIYNCHLENIRFEGNVNTTKNLHIAASHHMTGKNLTFRDGTNGMYLEWVVEGVWENIRCSTNDGAFSILQPTNGIYIAQTAPGYYSTNNIFINAIIEGVSGRGIYVKNGSNNVFIGGTSENNGIGMEISSAGSDNCRRNRVEGMWFEQNTSQDLIVNGDQNSFHDIYAGSNSPATYNVEIGTSAVHNQFYGGYLRSSNDQASTNQTSYYSVTLSDNGSLGIRHPERCARILGCRLVDNSANYTANVNDVLGTSGTATPSWVGSGTAGVFTYGATRSITWHRIGNLVCCNLRMAITAIGTSPTGTMSITGLPFTSAGASVGLQPVAFAEWGNVTTPTAGTTMIGGYINTSSTSITLTYSGFGVAPGIANAGFPAGSLNATTYISANFTYIAV